MEYSVNDLLKILLKKWYVILIAMLLVGAVSGVTSQMSYERALKQYEAYTQEKVPPVAYGSADAKYSCIYSATDNERYFQKDVFVEGYISAFKNINENARTEEEIKAEAEKAFAKLQPDPVLVSADFTALLADDDVWARTQAAVDALVAQGAGGIIPSVVAEKLTVTFNEDGVLHISVLDLKDDVSREAVSAFVLNLQNVGMEKYQLEISAMETHYQYTAIEQEYTQLAQLSQVVMKHPGEAPSLVKSVGTAAIFAFVFACFGVLMVTFIKETN